MKTNRIQRVSREMQKKISSIFHKEIRDPRFFKKVTILDVVLSKDLSYAKVFIIFFDILNNDLNQNNTKKNVKILNNKISNYIRFLLSKKLKLRIIPKLVFLYDYSVIEYNRLSILIDKVIRNQGCKSEA